MQQFKAFGRHRGIEDGYAREIAAGPVEAGNKPSRNRVVTRYKNDWNCFRRCFRHSRSRCDRQDNSDLTANQIVDEHSQPIRPILRPTIFNGQVAALDEAHFA